MLTARSSDTFFLEIRDDKFCRLRFIQPATQIESDPNDSSGHHFSHVGGRPVRPLHQAG
ncbi:MAG: hypothetical protein WBW41_03330 [Verrucomicrobiia bacterium]